MENMVAESFTGSNRALQIEKVSEVPKSSIRRILFGILHLNPYKLQSQHQIMKANIAAREALAEWAVTQIERTIVAI